jgi:hypothetical protein
MMLARDGLAQPLSGITATPLPRKTCRSSN